MKQFEDIILKMHGCKAEHIATVPVKEVFNGQTVWEGEVEVFSIEHPKAKICYAWSYPEGNETKYTTVLQIPPVKDPKTAVQASIMAQFKK